MTEIQRVEFAKTLKRWPPMPWYALNHWSDSDLLALYRFIKSLGPVGTPTPPFVPPDRQPSPPYIQWPAPPK